MNTDMISVDTYSSHVGESTGQTLTVGTSYWPFWQDTVIYLQPYPSWSWPPAEPVNCIGKAHVFECAHVKACKCGAIVRDMKAKRRKP